MYHATGKPVTSFKIDKICLVHVRTLERIRKIYLYLLTEKYVGDEETAKVAGRICSAGSNEGHTSAGPHSVSIVDAPLHLNAVRQGKLKVPFVSN